VLSDVTALCYKCTDSKLSRKILSLDLLIAQVHFIFSGTKVAHKRRRLMNKSVNFVHKLVNAIYNVDLQKQQNIITVGLKERSMFIVEYLFYYPNASFALSCVQLSTFHKRKLAANASIMGCWCRLFVYARFIVIVDFTDFIVTVAIGSLSCIFTTTRVVVFFANVCLSVCLSLSVSLTTIVVKKLFCELF